MAAKKQKEILGCIYLLTNLANGKRYVGQYKNVKLVERRWAVHIRVALQTDDQRPLYRAIRKAYKASKGLSLGFSAEVIWTGPIDKLNAKEIHFIKKLHAFNYDPSGDCSYNLTVGGEGAHGYRHTEASKKQMSASAQRRFEDPVERENNRLRQIALAAQPGARELRCAVRGTPAYKAKASASIKRYYASMTDEERKNFRATLSAAQLNRFARATPEQLKIWADTIKAGHQTPQSKARCSKSAEVRWASMTCKEREMFTDLLTQSKRTPQARANASSGVKAHYASMTAKELAKFTAHRLAACRTPQARANYAAGTRNFWSTMTPEERSAHYQATHPNGNGRELKKLTKKKPKK